MSSNQLVGLRFVSRLVDGETGGMVVLTIYEVRELVKLLEQTDVESIEIKEEDARLSIKRRSNGVVVQTQPATKVVLAPVKAAAPPKLKQQSRLSKRYVRQQRFKRL